MNKGKIILLSSLLLILAKFLSANPGDTIKVQTFTFGAPQDAWFVFPSDTVRFEKILMQYTLKCNPAQSPACGEWDYLTYTYLYDHTDQLDSTLKTQVLYTVNGNSPASFSYMNTPSYSYTTSWQYQTVQTSTVSLNTYQIGTGTTLSTSPFGSANPVSRSMYLWKASEMSAAGISAGNITGLRFYLQSLGSSLRNLTIRFKTTTLDSLTQANFSNTGFTTVYSHTRQFSSTGWNSIQLTNPFNWNGTSNLIVEITYDNTQTGTNNIIRASSTAFKSGLVNAGADRCLFFRGGGYADVPVNNALAAIDSFVTVSFWAYGNPLYQPMAGTCFEAVDENGTRVLNSHTPWSDGKVYWDAGNENGYDRIIKIISNPAQIKGEWNHWTFSKSLTLGTMKTYLNGVQVQSAGGKTRHMPGIDQFRIGKGNWDGSLSYEGKMDQFLVFDKELSASSILSLYRNKITPSHPDYSNLVLSYNFDDGNFVTAADNSPLGNQPATLNEGVNNPLKSAQELVTNFTEVTLRPNIVFEQGVYTSHLDSVLVIDSVMKAPVQIIAYLDSVNNPGIATDTLLVWPAYYSNYIYDAQGHAIDSTLVTPDGTITNGSYNYYYKFPKVIRYELARYITPYGNGLSLGNGWTWTFDVSDYRTLLADSVHLAAGNWQELLDMSFLMIKGTPPRDVVGIQNLYTGQFDYGHVADPIESHLTPLTVSIPANAQTFRWKSRVTGHGMDTPQNCAEFCPKTHYYKVDGTQRFSKLVWRDNCDLNPLYPQGGTWVYDRANWCPGAEVWTYDFELTPYVTPGSTAILDHDVQAYTNNGEWSFYQIEDQLVSYSAPNFSLDAALEDILSPSGNQMWLRYNPICNNPVIRIKNTGTTNLTSLVITYGVVGGPASVYNWSGNLGFLQTEEVTLGNFVATAGGNEFIVTISNPNGGADSYPYNNSMKTTYQAPPLFPSAFIIQLKTNNNPEENYYTLKDWNGNIIFQRNNLSPNTTYYDTLTLADGCYTFDLRDDGEDGLSWWANTAQGSGTISFRNATSGAVLKNYNSDFGGQVYQQFNVSAAVNIKDVIYTKTNSLRIYPNPTTGKTTLALDMNKKQNARIEISDITGRIVKTFEFNSTIAENIEADFSEASKGVYFVTLIAGDEKTTQKIIIQ